MKKININTGATIQYTWPHSAWMHRRDLYVIFFFSTDEIQPLTKEKRRKRKIQFTPAGNRVIFWVYVYLLQVRINSSTILQDSYSYGYTLYRTKSNNLLPKIESAFNLIFIHIFHEVIAVSSSNARSVNVQKRNRKLFLVYSYFIHLFRFSN